MTDGSEIAIRSGPWSTSVISEFLDAARIPIRLATSGRHFPVVQSLWFLHEDGALWCCTQADSVLAARLRVDRRIGFEVAADSPPYRGVRGTGHAAIMGNEAARILPLLIERYVGEEPSPLADWLLSRLDTEVAVRLDGLMVTSWDYSPRM